MTTRSFLCWIRLRIRRTASLSLAVWEGVERGEGGERTVRGGKGGSRRGRALVAVRSVRLLAGAAP